MGLCQAERCTLLLTGNASVLGLALCHHTHIWMMPSPCPCQRNSLGKGSPKARLGIAALPQLARAAWRSWPVDRAPSAYTAPKPLPDSVGWLMKTSRSKLQNSCPCFSLPSTRTLVWVPDPEGPQRWFEAESWCSSLNLPQASVFPATARPSFQFARGLPSAALVPLWNDHFLPPVSPVKYQHLC